MFAIIQKLNNVPCWYSGGKVGTWTYSLPVYIQNAMIQFLKEKIWQNLFKKPHIYYPLSQQFHF